MLNMGYTTLYSTQFHTFHRDLHLAPPYYPYIHFTSHPALIPFPSPHLADLHSTSLPFTSLHLSLSNPCSWKYSISSILQNHFPYHFLTFSPSIYLIFSLFRISSLPFTYHISAPFPANTRFPPHFEIPSLHFTYHFLTFSPSIYLIFPLFKISLPFTYHISAPFPANTRISSSFRNPFTSLITS